MRLVGILAVLAGTSSCTLLYAPPGSGGGEDGGMDGGDAVALREVEPAVVEEGQGGVEDPERDGAPLRGIPLVVRGEGIPQAASIEVEWGEDGALLLGDTFVSADGTLAAAPLGVPVLPESGREDEPAEIRVRLLVDGDPVGEPRAVEMTPLGELIHDEAGARAAESLARRYARIEITQTLILNGSVPARLHANERLLVSALVRARGDGLVPGPGGCAGGAGGSAAGGGDALCDRQTHPGNGTGGSIGEGGGGGGHFGPGQRGKVGSQLLGGPGGDAQGTPDLYPLLADRGYGGGGGGGTDGGSGGAGGGIVVLSSFGDLTLRGAVNVDGGAGGSSASGGGGGGGAGGAILLRARGRFSYDGDALLTARGGGGGQGNNGSDNEGGAGAGGRVRFDGSPSGNPSSPVGKETAFSLGPSWASRPIVTAPALELEGAVGASYDVYVGEVKAATVEITEPTGATVELPDLEPGLSRVCALVLGAAIEDVQPIAGDGRPPHPEAGTCLDVAYVP